MERNNGNSQPTRAQIVHHRRTGSYARTALTLTVLLLGAAATAYGQATDPWSTVAGQLASIFTGPIAKGFSLVATVLGGLELAFGEGGSRRAVGGLVFGTGLALGAASFISWITT
jgi:type IV secretory pathway VirB2 component (pilin)